MIPITQTITGSKRTAGDVNIGGGDEGRGGKKAKRGDNEPSLSQLAKEVFKNKDIATGHILPYVFGLRSICYPGWTERGRFKGLESYAVVCKGTAEVVNQYRIKLAKTSLTGNAADPFEAVSCKFHLLQNPITVVMLKGLDSLQFTRYSIKYYQYLSGVLDVYFERASSGYQVTSPVPYFKFLRKIPQAQPIVNELLAYVYERISRMPVNDAESVQRNIAVYLTIELANEGIFEGKEDFLKKFAKCGLNLLGFNQWKVYDPLLEMLGTFVREGLLVKMEDKDIRTCIEKAVHVKDIDVNRVLRGAFILLAAFADAGLLKGKIKEKEVNDIARESVARLENDNVYIRENASLVLGAFAKGKLGLKRIQSLLDKIVASILPDQNEFSLDMIKAIGEAGLFDGRSQGWADKLIDDDFQGEFNNSCELETVQTVVGILNELKAYEALSPQKWNTIFENEISRFWNKNSEYGVEYGAVCAIGEYAKIEGALTEGQIQKLVNKAIEKLQSKGYEDGLAALLIKIFAEAGRLNAKSISQNQIRNLLKAIILRGPRHYLDNYSHEIEMLNVLIEKDLFSGIEIGGDEGFKQVVSEVFSNDESVGHEYYFEALLFTKWSNLDDEIRSVVEAYRKKVAANDEISLEEMVSVLEKLNLFERKEYS